MKVTHLNHLTVQRTHELGISYEKANKHFFWMYKLCILREKKLESNDLILIL
jgi:hypothetical protein